MNKSSWTSCTLRGAYHYSLGTFKKFPKILSFTYIEIIVDFNTQLFISIITPAMKLTLDGKGSRKNVIVLVARPPMPLTPPSPSSFVAKGTFFCLKIS